MDRTNTSGSSRYNNNNRENLNIDNVVSSHPELGPTPPDGGYGWIILICAILTQITIPSIVYAYGVILLFLNLSEGYEENEIFHIYDHHIILTAILMVVFNLLYKEWARTLVLISNRPRVVSISGILLMAAGLLLSTFNADNGDSDLMISISSGLIIGIGASLVTQQTEILLRHYFRKQLPFVLSVYKSSVIFGNILIPLLMSSLLTRYGSGTSILVFTGLILQQCIAMLFLTRPTYVVKALSQNYKVLDEEDEDETIYSHARQNNASETQENTLETNNNVNETKNTLNIIVDDQDDEHVIATFDRGHVTSESTAQPTPNLMRYESQTNPNPFGSNFRVDFDQIERHHDPQTLYRETTVSNNINSDHIFSFDPPTTGTLRRTANTRKNITVFFSILKDLRFYAYTQILLSHNYSTLIFGALFPAFLSQQFPTMEMVSIIGMVLVVHIGALCFTLITTYFSMFKHKMVIRIMSFLAATSFIGLASSATRTSTTIWGVLSIAATNSVQISLRPIYDRTSTNFESTAISQASSITAGIIIFVIMISHNYTYRLCFEIAAILHMITPFLMYKY